MIKFKVEHNKITAKEVTKETDKTIWYTHTYRNNRLGVMESQERYERVSGSYHKWFNTFEEAKGSIVEATKIKLAYYTEMVAYTEGELDRVLTLKEEECLNQI